MATLANALSQIADTLPRIELQFILYPTDDMKEAVAENYASILRFLVRARDWYEESRIYHFIHSITRPVELRYQDIIEKISKNSQIIDKLAVAGQLAELRDMHESIRKLNAKVRQTRDTISRRFDITSS
jgi:hypothetical protein